MSYTVKTEDLQKVLEDLENGKYPELSETLNDMEEVMSGKHSVDYFDKKRELK